MSDAKSPQNLSMDEILATIRRIIAEDEQSSTTPGGAPGSTPGRIGTRAVPVAPRPLSVSPVPVSEERASEEHAIEAPRETAQEAAETAGADDVLELTDALDEDGSVRRLAPLATVSGAPEPARVLPVSGPEPARTRDFAERAAETMAAEAIPVDARPAGASLPVDRANDPGPTLAAATPFGAADERLVLEAAASEAAASFGRLAAVPGARHDPPLVGDRPLDEIVRELLRPLLRSWLNENLPGIVERLVQAEIAKISARSEPG
jgi:cell pole-organizing protein PopZ